MHPRWMHSLAPHPVYGVSLDAVRGSLVSRPSGSIQVQLVPSGGMTVQPKSVCVAKDGLVFHCDGLNTGVHRGELGAHSSAFAFRTRKGSSVVEVGRRRGGTRRSSFGRRVASARRSIRCSSRSRTHRHKK